MQDRRADGRLCFEQGLLSLDQVIESLPEQTRSDQLFGEIGVERRLLNEAQIAKGRELRPYLCSAAAGSRPRLESAAARDRSATLEA